RSKRASASILVTKSRTIVRLIASQNQRRSTPGPATGPSASFAILFLFLAGDAEPRVRQRIEPLEIDLGAALVTVPEFLRRAVEPAERLVHMPEIAAFLRGEQELLLPLHRVGALIGHMERVRRQIAVGRLQ